MGVVAELPLPLARSFRIESSVLACFRQWPSLNLAVGWFETSDFDRIGLFPWQNTPRFMSRFKSTPGHKGNLLTQSPHDIGIHR
jgi:hypothetical protein